MNAFILMLPFFAIRLLLLPWLNRDAARRAAESPPVYGGEKFASTVYQLSSVAIFIYPFFMSVEPDFSWQFWVGSALYLLGLALCAAAVVAYAHPDESGFASGGVYRFSRNPMYVGYLLVFLGVSALAKSPLLLSLTVMCQIAEHWVIKSEERWCENAFGDKYIEYMKRVRRYI